MLRVGPGPCVYNIIDYNGLGKVKPCPFIGFLYHKNGTFEIKAKVFETIFSFERSVIFRYLLSIRKKP